VTIDACYGMPSQRDIVKRRWPEFTQGDTGIGMNAERSPVSRPRRGLRTPRTAPRNTTFMQIIDWHSRWATERGFPRQVRRRRDEEKEASQRYWNWADADVV
jgi:hypothetical protein